MPTPDTATAIAALSAKIRRLEHSGPSIGALEMRRFFFGVGAIDHKL
jgi:hypothetical protein